MSSGIIAIIVIIAVVVLIGGYVMGAYNSLVRARNAVTEAWGQIDTNLQRRYDLIPNLVNTVKGYAAHESETLEKITNARALAGAAHKSGSVKDAALAENAFKDAMVAVNAVAENYPQLRAVESFTQLQEELTTTENKVGFARQNYNDVVRDYNDNIQVFPKNIIAGAFNFKPADTFAVETEEARRAPKVEF